MLHKSNYLKELISCYIPCLSFAENDETMSDELKPTNGKKLSDSVAQLIKEAIITNRIPPGERLFDEKDFLKTY